MLRRHGLPLSVARKALAPRANQLWIFGLIRRRKHSRMHCTLSTAKSKIDRTADLFVAGGACCIPSLPRRTARSRVNPPWHAPVKAT